MKHNNVMIFNPKDGSLQLSECDLLIVDGLKPESSVSWSPGLIVLIHKLFSHPLINFGHGMDG